MQAAGVVVGAVPAASTPAAAVCFATIGRKMLVRKPIDAGRSVQFELFDPWTQQTLWSSPAVSSLAKTSVLNEEAIGVLEPTGRFLLLELAGGRMIADASLPSGDATGIHVIRSGDQYLLSVMKNRRLKPGVFVPAALPGTQTLGLPSGRLYAIDGKGKLMWPRPCGDRGRIFVAEPAGTDSSDRFRQPAVRAEQRTDAADAADCLRGQSALAGSFTPATRRVRG